MSAAGVSRERRRTGVVASMTLAAVLWPLAAGAQSANGAERAVARAEQEWTDAIAKKEVKTIDRLVADDFVETTAYGMRLTKSAHLAQVRNGVYDVQSVRLENVRVRILGNVAIVTYAQIEQSRYNGRDNSGRYLYMDVFAKRRNAWQVVAEQATRP